MLMFSTCAWHLMTFTIIFVSIESGEQCCLESTLCLSWLLHTAGGNYSGAFMNEFKIFVAELRDFFNAAGLTQLLENVKGAMGPEDQQVTL